MSALTPEQLVCTAAALAGRGASDEEVANQFARAAILLERAQNWLSDPERQDRETFAYVLSLAQEADSADPILPWNHPALHRISGYDGDGHARRTLEERGRLLWDAVDKALGRTFGDLAVKTLREKFRDGIEESRLRNLWPQLSKWRRKAGQPSSSSGDAPDI